MTVQSPGRVSGRAAGGRQGLEWPRRSLFALPLPSVLAYILALVPMSVAALVALAFLVSGCSADFPSIHDMPPPRADTPLTPDQVNLETKALISDRNHLSGETQSGVQPAVIKSPLPPPTQANAQTPGGDPSQITGAVTKP